jgi:bifunctional UDP-N-acetylglucosamine pyrophosphorylase/glucosamine-1-phosphate N-acetyltransferase
VRDSRRLGCSHRRAQGRHAKTNWPSARSTPASTPSTGLLLRAALAQLTTDNVQGEKYLTDVLGIARSGGSRVGAFVLDDVWQCEGVNDKVQLARLGAELNRRTVEAVMRAGAIVIDPATTWIDADVSVGI